MIECRCPKCQSLFTARTADFGTAVSCTSCGRSFLLDTDALVLPHYEFPLQIIVQLADTTGAPIALSGIEVQAERGFRLVPVLTDASGAAVITRDHYERSKVEWDSWSIMDHPGDYSLIRHITLWVDGRRAFGPERFDLAESGKNPTVVLAEGMKPVYWEGRKGDAAVFSRQLFSLATPRPTR